MEVYDNLTICRPYYKNDVLSPPLLRHPLVALQRKLRPLRVPGRNGRADVSLPTHFRRYVISTTARSSKLPQNPLGGSLLSDHNADVRAPCVMTFRANIDNHSTLRHVCSGKIRGHPHH
jgi:hypothetical protein